MKRSTRKDPKTVVIGTGYESLCETATDATLAACLREIPMALETWNCAPSDFLDEKLNRAASLASWLDPSGHKDADGYFVSPIKTPNDERSQNTRNAFYAVHAVRACVKRGARPPDEDIQRLLWIADALDGRKADRPPIGFSHK